MGRGRIALSGFVAAALVAVAAYGELPWRHPLPGAERRFDASAPAWAADGVVHLGGQQLDVRPAHVRGMLATPYGAFLTVAEGAGPDAPRRLVWFDGRELVEVPGHVAGAAADVAVSPDGRYAGWVDREGPWSVAGRLAEVVVVDLATGRAVLRDHQHMGGGWGDDLADRYEELAPTVVGFGARGRVYWTDAEGDVWRADVRAGTKASTAHGRSAAGGPVSYAAAYNPRLGRVTPDRAAWESPTGTFEVDRTVPDDVRVTDTRTGRRVALDHGRRRAAFGGWGADGVLYAVVADGPLHPGSGRRVPGAVVRCRLPSGTCREVARVVDLGSFSFGHGEPVGG